MVKQFIKESTAPKTAEGKNEYYLTEIKDADFKTKSGEEVKQKMFAICNHKSQQVQINLQEGKVSKVEFVDFSKFDDKTKEGTEKKTAYTADYLKQLEEKLTGLDKNLLTILDSVQLEFKPYEPKSKGDEGIGNDDVPPAFNDQIDDIGDR